MTASLVSVIVRSIDRPELKEALASVAAQAYPAVEAVVVDATGRHGPLPPASEERPVRLVSLGEPLGHSRAANVGLDNARGRYVLLLDDDDLFLPEHVERLVRAVEADPQARAAYGGVRVEGAHGVMDVYDADFDPVRLLAWNHLPTAGVMFERSLVDEGLRFDEALPLYEDWDFWLQVSRRTRFARSPGISAVYRPHLGNSGMIAPERQAELTAARHQVWRKWLPDWPAQDFERFVQSFKTECLDKGEALAKAAFLERDLRQLWGDAQAVADERLGRIAQLEAALAASEAHARGLEQGLEAVRSSASWRVTAPLRAVLGRRAGG